MAYTPKTPGKKGTITDVLMNKNIGIDGKTFQLIDERVPMVQKANYQIGDRIEYRIASQGDLTVKGKINFIGPDKDAPATTCQPPAQPTNLPDQPQAAAPAKREPRIIQGQYLSKTGSSITLKDGKGNAEAWKADIDLIAFLNNPEPKVKPMDMVKVRLIDNHGEWIAKDMGPFDPSIPETPLKTGQELLKENRDEKQADSFVKGCNLLPEKCNDIGCAIPGNMPLCLKEWIPGASYHPICIHSNIGAGRVERQVAKPVETITDTEHADLIARGEAAKMAKIQKEAAEHAEKMKAENAARRASEQPPETLVKSQPAIKNPTPAVQPEDAAEPEQEYAAGPVELGIHLDMGSYTNFDLKVSELTADRAIARLEADAMKTISMMRRLMSAAKKGY